MQDEVYDGWQHYPTKYTAIKEVKIGIENREIVSKMTINYDLENWNLDFRLFFSSRSDFAVYSSDDSALSENTRDNLDTCRATQGNAV